MNVDPCIIAVLALILLALSGCKRKSAVEQVREEMRRFMSATEHISEMYNITNAATYSNTPRQGECCARHFRLGTEK